MKKLFIFFMIMILPAMLSAADIDVDDDSNDAVDIDSGGTNATTASAARTNLGLVIGTNVLAPNGDGSGLTNVDAATGDCATGFFDAGTIEHEYGGLEANVSAYNGIVKISGGTTSAVATSANGESLIGAADYAAMKALLDLEIGTDVQAQSTILQTIADAADVPGANLDITNTTSESSIASDDKILIYDVTAAANRSMTRSDFVAGIGGGGFDSTNVDSTTWSDGANASNTWTFDVSGTDHTMIAGDGIVTFSNDVTVSGTLTGTTAVAGKHVVASSNADPAATGEIRHDSTVAGFTNGALRWYDGSGIRQLIGMAAATAEGCTDDYVIAYDADADLWYCKVDDNTGSFDSTNVDSTTWSDGGNASNTWTFDVSGTDHTMVAGNGLMTFSHDVQTGDLLVRTDDLDYAAGLGVATIYSDGDGSGQTNSIYLLRLAHESATSKPNDGFIVMEDNANGMAVGDVKFKVGAEGKTTITSDINSWTGLHVSNTQAIINQDYPLIKLEYADSAGDTAGKINFVEHIANSVTLLKSSEVGLKIGTGTPDETMDGGDLYVSDHLEVDGTMSVGGLLTVEAGISGIGDITSGDADPIFTLRDTTAAAAGTGEIHADAITAGQDSTLTVYVDESDGEKTPYLTLDGVNELVTFGSATIDSKAIKLIMGAQADDPEFSISMSTDANGDVFFWSANGDDPDLFLFGFDDFYITDDIVLDSDGAAVVLGADQDVTLTHVADVGANLKSIATADDKPVKMVMQTGETDIEASDVLGGLYFQAPDEGTGTDAILIAAGIEAVSEGDFSASNNATKLSFKTGASEVATEKASISSGGNLTINTGDVIIGSTNPSSTGDLRFPNASTIKMRNFLNSADITAMTVSTGNYVQLGTGGTGVQSMVAHTMSGTLGVTGVATFSDATEASAIGTAGTVIVGGASIAKDLWIGDDIVFDSDAAVIKLGDDQDITVTHVADVGFNVKQVGTGDDTPIKIVLQNGETDIAVDDVLGGIYFQAPDEANGTDAILVAAGIEAVSEGDFSTTNNATKLSFKTGASEVATEKMTLSSTGVLNVTGGITSAGTVDLGGATTEIWNSTSDMALTTAGQIGIQVTDDQFVFHGGAAGEIQGEAAHSLLQHFAISFDPKVVCDGAVDRLFLMTIGDDAPEGIIITEWKLSFEADPTTEVDLDFKYADAFIGVANAAVVDALDTTNGVSSEDTNANINGGAAVANGKVLYLEFGTAYTETTHQIIFEFWYYAEED